MEKGSKKFLKYKIFTAATPDKKTCWRLKIGNDKQLQQMNKEKYKSRYTT